MLNPEVREIIDGITWQLEWGQQDVAEGDMTWREVVEEAVDRATDRLEKLEDPYL